MTDGSNGANARGARGASGKRDLEVVAPTDSLVAWVRLVYTYTASGPMSRASVAGGPGFTDQGFSQILRHVQPAVTRPQLDVTCRKHLLVYRFGMPTPFRLVGVLHLPPLPGAVNYGGISVRAIADRAAEDAIALRDAGFTHVMVQDASDMPQAVTVGAPTVAALAVIGAAVSRAVDLPVGVVVGHNDGPSAVAIAHAIGATFVRVKVLTGVSVGPTGWIQGCAHEVAAMQRLLGSDVEVWADVHEATSIALASTPRWAATEARAFGGADVLVVTRDSGVADAVAAIADLRTVMPDVPVVVGGRVGLDTIDAAIAGSDGAILGSAIKRSAAPDARVDPDVADRFGQALTAARV